jgi:hypothetical protein
MKSANTWARISSFARITSNTILPLIASLAACTGETVTMGEDDTSAGPLPAHSRCLESTTVSGAVDVSSQGDIDALEGCQVIEGHLTIGSFEGANLLPLHELTTVRGTIWIGMESPLDAPSPGRPLLESLDGLESLESAGSFDLRGLLADNVDSLRNLENLTAGRLWIQGSPNLKNLDGLAKLRPITDLRLDCPQLEDIAPLTLSDTMNGLSIVSGKLTQLSPLGVAIVSPGPFGVAHTELQNLDAFAGLVYAAGSVFIENNLLLENIDALNDLQAAGELTIWHNPLLTRLPTFPALGSLDGLQIVFNDSLTEVPAFPFVTADLSTADQLSLLDLSTAQAVISDNPALTSIALPRGWLGGSALIIDNNASLTQVTLTQQLSYDYLSITNNPGLASIDIGVLGTVDLLEVANNPQLDPGVFDTVRTFETRMSANGAAQ